MVRLYFPLLKTVISSSLPSSAACHVTNKISKSIGHLQIKYFFSLKISILLNVSLSSLLLYCMGLHLPCCSFKRRVTHYLLKTSYKNNRVQKNAILISCWFPVPRTQKKIEIFRCSDCRLAAPIAFFRGSLPPETFERLSIIFDYC